MADYDDLPYIVIERRGGGLSQFLLGALLGAGVGLLLAPRSGRETRRQLRDAVERARDAAEGTVRQVQNTVSGTVDDLRRQVSEGVDAARGAMEAGRAAARQTRNDLERRIRESQGLGYGPLEEAGEAESDGDESGG